MSAAGGGSTRWLTPEGLERLLARWAAGGALVAPVEVEGELLFQPVRDPARIARDYVNSLVPPREIFLPTPERLVSYRVENGQPALEEEPAAAPAPFVLFGVRSCDVAGLAHLERFFSGALFAGGEPDARFRERREAAVLVSVVCRRAGPHCMCVCGEGGPALARGFDWQLTGLEDGWLVEIGSPRGERLAADSAAELSDPPADAAGRAAAAVREAVESFAAGAPRRVPTMAAARMISAGRLDASFWKAVGDRCFECGGCAFVCPTCWCFNVADLCEPGGASFWESAEGMSPTAPGALTGADRDGRWERLRLRDNCVLSGFVRQAGGGYPRWTVGERCHTRFFHKLSQQFRERLQGPGCTGCGRCAQVCMGEQGIDRIAEAMRQALLEARRAALAPAAAEAEA